MAVQRSRTQPGDGWRTVAFVTWALVLAGTAAVAVSSRTIGRPTWWLGPPSDPASPVMIMIPVALVGLPVIAHLVRHRLAAPISVAACVGLLGSALVDAADTSAVATGFAIVALAGLIGHVAVWVGLRQYR